MEVFRGLDVIRCLPHMYVPALTLEAIGSCLVDDARELGAMAVHTSRQEDWYVVSTDVDWLRLPVHSMPPFDELFTRLLFHPTRINGIRAEALVGALARAAYVATPSERKRVVGSLVLPPKVSAVMAQEECIRSVAFTLG